MQIMKSLAYLLVGALVLTCNGVQAKHGVNIPSCAAVTVLPYSENGQPDNPLTGEWGFGWNAAVYLAMKHWNTRDTSVVPELFLVEDCKWNFTGLMAADSEQRQVEAVANFLNILQTNLQPNFSEDNIPCALIGPERTLGLELTKGVAYALDFAHMSPVIDHNREGESSIMVPLTPRNTVYHRAQAVYLQRINRDFLNVIVSTRPEGNGAAVDLTSLGRPLGLTVGTYTKLPDPAYLDPIIQTGFKTFYIYMDNTRELTEIAGYMDDRGLLDDPDNFFILATAATGPLDLIPRTLKTTDGSPLHKLLQGALVFDWIDGFELNSNGPENDPFVQAWKELGPEDVAYLNELSPETNNFTAPDDYFQTYMPGKTTSLHYDAAIAIGIGSCTARGEVKNATLLQQTDLFTRNLAHQGSVGSSSDYNPAELVTNFISRGAFETGFSGASGRVEYVNGTRSVGFAVGAYNIRCSVESSRRRERTLTKDPSTLPLCDGISVRDPDNSQGGRRLVTFEDGYRDLGHLVCYDPCADEEDDEASEYICPGAPVTCDYTLVSVYDESVSTDWVDVEGESFLFRSGSTEAPKTSRVFYEQHFLQDGVRVFGLTLMVIAWIIAIVGAILVIWLRNDEAMKTTQPPFVLVLCVGSLLLSATIYVLSFDEGTGHTDSQLDIMCGLAPWFFFGGHIVSFTAIFTKLYRLNKVLELRFQRATVTAISSSLPLLIFWICTLGVLISWTLVDPWHWERDIIDTLRAETYGECECDRWWLWFGTLLALVVGAEVLTIFFAWKTSNAPDFVRETSEIRYTIMLHMQSWAIGVPILAVVDTDPDAIYISRVALVWIFSVSSVLLMAYPKAIQSIRIRLNPNLKRSGVVRVTGMGVPQSSSASSQVTKPSAVLANQTSTDATRNTSYTVGRSTNHIVKPSSISDRDSSANDADPETLKVVAAPDPEKPLSDDGKQVESSPLVDEKLPESAPDTVTGLGTEQKNAFATLPDDESGDEKEESFEHEHGPLIDGDEAN